MALNENIRKKIDEKTIDYPGMARDLKILLNACEEGRQTSPKIKEFLKRIN